MKPKNTLSSVMVHHVEARGTKSTQPCLVLFDSGASDSFVSRELAELLGAVTPLTDGPKTFLLADGSPLAVAEGVTFTLFIKGQPVTDRFIINPGMGTAVDEVILGATTMSKYGMSVDFKHNDIVFSLQPAAHAVGARPLQGVINMNEILKRILARLGVSDIAPELTDEDAMAMILERCNRGYSAVATPSILSALALKDDATETDARTAIAALKTLKVSEAPLVPTPSVTFAGVFSKLGITARADLTEPQAIDLIAAQVKKPVPATAVAAKGVLAVLDMPDTATEEEVVGALLALKYPGNVVTAEQHRDLESQHREYKLNTMVDSALRAGKLTPAEKAWALEKVKEWDALGLDGISTLEQFLGKRPKLMPIGERLPMHTVATDMGLDEDTLKIARQMGVTTEMLKKYAQ